MTQTPEWLSGAYPLILVDMAELKDPRKGVKDERIVYHLADGTPTTDKDRAATAEITTIYDDGRQEVTLLQRS